MTETIESHGSGPWLIRNWSWVTMGLVASVVATGTIPVYIGFDPDKSPIKLWSDPKWMHYAFVAVHSLTGSLALILGPIQFSAGVRQRYPEIHRQIGRTYLVIIASAAFTAFASAILSTSGLQVQAALGFVALLWFYSAWRAYEAIRHRRDVVLHRRWMIRNYYITFGAVTFRLVYFLGATVFAAELQRRYGYTRAELEHEVYQLAVWTPVAVNVIVGEWLILEGGTSRCRAVDRGTGATKP